MENDRIHLFRKFKYNASNHFVVLDNFKENKNDPVFLDRCEVETRILKRLYDSELVDLNTFNFNKDIRDDLKLDSLNIVVILTEIENEFTTVFEDRVFESVRRLGELVDILVRDEKVF